MRCEVASYEIMVTFQVSQSVFEEDLEYRLTVYAPPEVRGAASDGSISSMPGL